MIPPIIDIRPEMGVCLRALRSNRPSSVEQISERTNLMPGFVRVCLRRLREAGMATYSRGDGWRRVKDIA